MQDNKEELKKALMKDLHRIGINTKGLNLVLRPFSKRMYGRYNVKSDKIFIYIYADKEQERMYPYEVLLGVALHESVHREQWLNPFYIRQRGVMHDAEFYSLFRHYMLVAKKNKIRIEEVI